MFTQKFLLSAFFVVSWAGASVYASTDDPQGGFGGPPPADLLFSVFDANDDGALTEDEVFAPMWTRLKNADSDGDGSVTRAEYEALTRG